MPERGDTGPGGTRSADRLRRARRKRSLTEVAAAAAISTAYLQKLEAGAVSSRPRTCSTSWPRRSSINYASLMRLAGYVVPSAAAPAR